MRQITNPPNPYNKYSAEYVGEPPPTKLEIFEETATKKMITKAFASDWEGGWRYTVNCYRAAFTAALRLPAIFEYLIMEQEPILNEDRSQANALSSRQEPKRDTKMHTSIFVRTDLYLPLEASYELTRNARVCVDFRSRRSNYKGFTCDP